VGGLGPCGPPGSATYDCHFTEFHHRFSLTPKHDVVKTVVDGLSHIEFCFTKLLQLVSLKQRSLAYLTS